MREKRTKIGFGNCYLCCFLLLSFAFNGSPLESLSVFYYYFYLDTLKNGFAVIKRVFVTSF